MPDQIPLFVEDYNEAIAATVAALRGIKKSFAVDLFPELSIDAATRRLSDCVNPDRRDILSPQHLGLLRRIARQNNVHILAAFEMRDAGYAEPQPLEPEDERAALQRRFIEQSLQMKALFAQMERAGLRLAA